MWYYVVGVVAVLGAVALSCCEPARCCKCKKELKKDDGGRQFYVNEYIDDLGFSKYYKKEYGISVESFDNRLLCKKCYAEIKKQFDTIKHDEEKYYLKQSFIEVFSERYKGKIPNRRENEEYETEFYDNKEYALEEMKRYAVKKEKDMIYNLKEIYQLVTEGNYTHKIWQYVGNVAKRM